MTSFTTTTVAVGADASYLHNGPVCSICHRGYVGSHVCSVADLRSAIAALNRHIDRIEGRQQ